MKRIFLLLFIFVISNIKSQSLYFPPLNGSTWDTLSPASLNWCKNNIDSFYNYLESKNTKAFILLKDGKIVLEKYFGTFTIDSIWYWASAGKSLTATLVGIAQEDKFLSIQDTSAKYLGNSWTKCTSLEEKKITIKNQLSMTSGLDDGVSNKDCTIDTCLKCLSTPGSRWAYHNAPYTLLDKVIETATSYSINTYNTLRIKNKTGMTGLYIKNGDNNVYYSTARSMARFGLLILNKGKWDNTFILGDSNYYNQMVNTSQNLNLSYGYLWWLNGKASCMAPTLQTVFNTMLCPNAPPDMFAAIGKNGQFVNVVPSQKLVFIRMGNTPEGGAVPFTFNDSIWLKLKNLPCKTSSFQKTEDQTIDLIKINPRAFLIQTQSEVIHLVSAINMQGKEIKLHGQDNIFDCSHLLPGIYFIKVNTLHGISMNRFYIE